jgi:AcrR family transcriptional regulator
VRSTSAPRRPGRPRGGGLSHDQAREHILDATEACFARFGLEKTTVDDIAAEAGLSRSMIYRHFRGRDELLTGVLARLTDRFIAELADRIDDHATLGDFIVEAITEVVLVARLDPTLAAMFVGADRSAAGDAVARSGDIKSRARGFAHQVLERVGPERIAELRPGLAVDDAADHLMLIGLALIQGYGPTGDEQIRDYLRAFVLPALVSEHVPATTSRRRR